MTKSFFSTKLQRAYSVGALLYTPASRNTIASAVCRQQFGTRYSLALCLEDTINDAYLLQAEQQAAYASANCVGAGAAKFLFAANFYPSARPPNSYLVC